MEYSSLKEYLFESGILDTGSSEQIAEAKKTYRKNYQRNKKQQYRKRRKIVQLTFTKTYAKTLAQQAESFGMRLPDFIKKCVRAYLEKTFLLPNPKEVQQVELLLLKIGNNVNQIAHRVNAAHLDSIPALESVRQLLVRLDQKITEALRTPKDLEACLKENLRQNPSVLLQLERIIDSYKDAYQDNTA